MLFNAAGLHRFVHWEYKKNFFRNKWHNTEGPTPQVQTPQVQTLLSAVMRSVGSSAPTFRIVVPPRGGWGYGI